MTVVMIHWLATPLHYGWLAAPFAPVTHDWWQRTHSLHTTLSWLQSYLTNRSHSTSLLLICY